MSALPNRSTARPPRQQSRRPHWSTRTALWLGIIGIVITCIDIVLVVAGDTQSADRTILLDIHRGAPAALGPDMRMLSLVGGPTGMDIIVVAAALYFLSRRHIAAGVIAVCGLGGAELIETGLKDIVARPRPHLWSGAQIVQSYSFPSGHATAAAATAAALAFAVYAVYGRRAALAASLAGALAAVTIGFSRLFLGVHWPTDVVGGFALALAWVSLVFLLVGRYWSAVLQPPSHGRVP